jgi:hypothetical protein
MPGEPIGRRFYTAADDGQVKVLLANAKGGTNCFILGVCVFGYSDACTAYGERKKFRPPLKGAPLHNHLAIITGKSRKKGVTDGAASVYTARRRGAINQRS